MSILKGLFLSVLREGYVYAAIIVVTLELSLRMLAPFSPTVRLLLWSPANGVQYDFIRTVDDVARFLPTMWKPGSYHAGYRLDEHGFWTEPYETLKTEGTIRLVAIGDSFTYSSGGVPRPKLWHSVLASQLSKQFNAPVQDVNLGLPGAGPRLEKRVLEIEGLRIQPDIVTLALFMGNDFTDEIDTRPWILKVSYTSRFLSALVRLPEQLRTLRKTGGLFQSPAEYFEPGKYHYDRNVVSFPDDAFRRIEIERSQLFSPDNESVLRKLSSEVADVVLDMKRQSEAAGAKFIVMLIPDEVQVNAKLRSSMNAELASRNLAPVDAAGAQTIVLKNLADRGIDVVDTLPMLTKEAQNFRSPYRINDTHWDERGNLIGGEAVAAFLATHP